LSNYKYIDVEFDTYKYIPNQRGKMIKTISGKKICRWAQFPDGQKGIIPSILEELLAARKATRTMAKFKTLTTTTNETHIGIVKQNENTTTVTDKNKVTTTINNVDIVSIKDTYDDFMKNIFDKRQQGYKVTANSTYGGTGAKTSDFYEPDVAASTTAVGRMLLLYGKRIIEEIYGDKICNTSYGTVHSHAEYIYGDTDSVFISFKLTDLEGKPIKGKDALKITIELAKEAGELATKFLKKPHDLEYEKTFMPFALLSKKRYVGMLYEEDPNKCKRKSMGIVLKRRDNAPIVKDIYGGVIDILMEDLKEDETESDKIVKAMNFTRQFLQDMVNEKFSTSKLIISKSIRSFYKNPQSIAHKVLADRMGIRDSGNKPRSGDRIPFMYIQTKEKVKLQGDKIEHPDFIEKNKLKPDYGFYITNQIMKPLLQVFALVLYKMPEFKRKSRNFQNKLEILKQTLEKNKYIEKESKLKNKEVEKILFEEVLRKVKNKKEGNVSIPDMFKGLLDNSYRF
jgi:DNA polymerase elongation subunit (family B)